MCSLCHRHQTHAHLHSSLPAFALLPALPSLPKPDGLGYHDDGEEHYNEDDNAAQFKKSKSKKSGANAALTKDALRRARKSKEMAASDADGDGDGKKAGGMWDFVNKGVGGGGAAAARKSGGGFGRGL